MTITFIDSGNIFDSKCQTLVCPVNIQGITGAGLIEDFKKKFPFMYKDYKRRCQKGIFKIGIPYVFDIYPVYQILLFPTKKEWDKPSKLEYIQEGLMYLKNHYKEMNIKSIAIPALGCGFGKLNWSLVRLTFIDYLSSLEIKVEIYNPNLKKGDIYQSKYRLMPAGT